MLVPTSEPTEAALGRLSPSDRALLELSLRQRVPDDDVAALLRVEPGEVERRRGDLLEGLAPQLDLRSGSEAADALREGWGVPVDRRRKIGPAAMPAMGARSRRPLLLFALAAVIAVIALVLLTGGGDSSAPAPPAAAPAAPVEPAPAPSQATGKKVALSPVAGSSARASMRQVDKGLLRMQIDEIPPGSYTVWLYDNVADSAPLVRFEAKPGTVDIRVPADAGRYRFIDVSREPADRNPNHSGASVLRVPVQQVLGRP